MEWAKIEDVIDWCTVGDLDVPFGCDPNELIINRTREVFIAIDKIIYIAEGNHGDLSFIVTDACTFTVKGAVGEAMNEIEWWRNRGEFR